MTVVIGSAIVPTLIAQKFFRPDIAPVIAFDVAAAPSGIMPQYRWRSGNAIPTRCHPRGELSRSSVRGSRSAK